MYPSSLIEKILLARALSTFWVWACFFCPNPGDNFFSLFTCWTNCFQVRLLTTPIWAGSEVCRLWRHVSTRVAWVIPLGHRSTIFQNFSTNALTDSPFRCFVARRVGMVTSESSSKKRVRKSFSKSPQFLMEPSGSFMNHSKASPFRVPMNKRIKIASLSITFPV